MLDRVHLLFAVSFISVICSGTLFDYYDDVLVPFFPLNFSLSQKNYYPSEFFMKVAIFFNSSSNKTTHLYLKLQMNFTKDDMNLIVEFEHLYSESPSGAWITARISGCFKPLS